MRLDAARFVVVVFLAAANGLASSDALAAPKFTDVTAASGLKIADNTGVNGTNPHCVAIEDFDGDGKFDIVIATFGAPHVRYFRNLGNLKFADVTRGSGLESFQGEGTGAAIADYDHDGKLDLFLTSVRGSASRLYRGKGDGTFLDASEAAGVVVKEPARSAAWSDVDGDGWVDLYVTCPSGPNRLFRNLGNGKFSDIAAAAGVQLADRHSLGCAFADIDGDGLDDLFVTNYQSQASTMFHNEGGGKFKDITAIAGLDRKASSVGCIFADFTRSNRFDLYVTTDSWLSGANYTEPQLREQGHTVEPNLLYFNHPFGKYKPVAGPMSEYKSLSHDAIAEDLDHDGALDLYVAVDAESGNQWATSKGGNPLWVHDAGARGENKPWREIAAQIGIKHQANCVCCPAVDFDGDGDLDLLLVNFYSNVVLYRNDTNDKRWLRIKAVGSKSNPDGIGAKVSVFGTEAGKPAFPYFRQIQSGEGYCRCSPLETHVGLGNVAGPYRVEVRFPGSNKLVKLEGVEPGQRIVVREEGANEEKPNKEKAK